MESHTSHTKGLPRLGDVCPDLVKDVVSLLREASPGDPIADSIADLPFLGALQHEVHGRRRHINMLGRYSFPLLDLPGGLRPLREPDAADEE